MQFWRGNKIDQPFEMTPEEVADAFYRALVPDADMRLKWFNWARSRVVSDWMTRPDGLNATWTDDSCLDQVLDAMQAMAPAGSLGICPACGGEYPVRDDHTLARHDIELTSATKQVTVMCIGIEPESWRL